MPGRPEESPIVEAVRYGATIKMPPAGKLPDRAIADLADWVKMGVPWPESPARPVSTSGAGVPNAAAIAEAARRHWAFRPVRDGTPPPVRDVGWPRDPLDRFILARLEAAGVVAVSTGRPADPDPPRHVRPARAAADPRGGRRLRGRSVPRRLRPPGRPPAGLAAVWRALGAALADVARYADTKGYILFQDADFHWAYTYRDYVIAAFNRDTPYDRFIVEQLAADRLSRDDLPDASAQPPLAALGFLSLGGRFMGNFHDVVDDRIDVVCRGLMSLTVTCARCHDHKFDPIPTRDYYSLYGVLASAREPMIPPEAARSPRTAALRGVRPRAGRPAGQAGRVRRGQASRARGRGEAAGGRVSPGRPAVDRPAHHRGLHAHRRRDRPQPGDAGPLAIVPGADPQGRDPVFAPWHALAALPPGEFARRSAPLIAELVKAASGGPAVNPVIARAWPRVAPARWPTWRGSTAALNRVEGSAMAAAWAGLGRTPRWPSRSRSCAGCSTARTARSMYRSTPSACWPCCPTGRRRRSTMSCATPCRSG